MDNDKDLPKRKSTRLKNYDYSSAGAYFVTICVRDRMQILSEIVRTDLTAADRTNGIAVGEGLVSRVTWFTNCEGTWFTTFCHKNHSEWKRKRGQSPSLSWNEE